MPPPGLRSAGGRGRPEAWRPLPPRGPGGYRPTIGEPRPGRLAGTLGQILGGFLRETLVLGSSGYQVPVGTALVAHVRRGSRERACAASRAPCGRDAFTVVAPGPDFATEFGITSAVGKLTSRTPLGPCAGLFNRNCSVL